MRRFLALFLFSIALLATAINYANPLNENDRNKQAREIAKSNGFNFGPWVEYRHRKAVFARFNSALLWSPPEKIIEILLDARASDTKLFLQLGSAGDWGWDFDYGTSNFTLEKWMQSAARFTENEIINAAISQAISDGTIRSVYLIDEPHHTRWSPSQNDSNFITNEHIDTMAKYIKSYWPNVRTSVRASPRALASYNRQRPDWQYLDEAFVMINYNKWAKNGIIRTIDGFLRRELKEAKRQNIDIIGSVQMLIGSPPDSNWWEKSQLGKPNPVGKLAASPKELETYINRFTKPRSFFGFKELSTEETIDSVMFFRWDRNDESDWENPHYKQSIDSLIKVSNGN